MKKALAPGLYEHPLTEGLHAQLAEVDDALKRVADLDPELAPILLTQLVQRQLVASLRNVDGKGDAKLTKQLELANAVLALLAEHCPEGGGDGSERLIQPGRVLEAVLTAGNALAPPLPPDRPLIPLSTSDLLVNGRHDLSLGAEVKREIASADRIDLLCSFLKWSGFRLVERQLRDFVRRRPTGLRVLTTAYMRATEPRAIEALIELGADVRVSYDTQRTRLHAKAWLFHRDSGFSTGFVGSSNLSAAAMIDGVEWNVRLSQRDNEPILRRFRTAFEQYWDNPEFQKYNREDFQQAIQLQTNHANELLFRFNIEPRPHQQEILDDLASERERGHTRNLVVAATGTGKTVVAALDYRRICADYPGARLLFVAHRAEILKQSLATYRVVMKDGTFGELYVGDARPVHGTHVFASIQSLNARGIDSLDPDTFDVVVVDEFHHAAAPSYARLLERLKPKVLLGLTATPERTDGASIKHWFDDRIASELRLWNALDQELLVPFHYFGVGGAPDASGIKWSRGSYDTRQLSNLYSADHFFAKRVIQEVAAKVADISKMRGLGFCIDVAHAHFMAEQFRQAGVAAAAVSGETKRNERARALQALRSGNLNILFCVDLFNEGVDVPNIETVVFLRPTESATIFLQQLGRGLRRSPNKACLTVLDFIGGAHRKFRFDKRFRAILGGTRKQVVGQIEQGFPHLPSGCVIELDRVAQAAVLRNVKQSLGHGTAALVEDVRVVVAKHGPDVTLSTFLRESGVELDDVYSRPGRCWTDLRRRAGVPAEPSIDSVERAFSRMLHVDDTARLDAFRQIVSADHPPTGSDTDDLNGDRLRALYVLLGHGKRPFSEMREHFEELWARACLRRELVQLLDELNDRTRTVTTPLNHVPELAAVPLRVHATYTLDEVLTAVGERSGKGGMKRIQTGSYFAKSINTSLHFVTLEKHEKHYSPTTLYNDYPISRTRFHWETQGNGHSGTETGQRYVTTTPKSSHHSLLFVRTTRADERGITCPYVLLGRCFYLSHTGERPMAIEWALEQPMPAGLWQETKIAAG